MRFLALTTLLLALGASESVALAAPSDAALHVQSDADQFVLQVPVSRIVMIIPREHLAQKNPGIGGSTDNPRYFYFDDSEQGLAISGWFEPAQGFKGLQAFWDAETREWAKHNQPEPEGVSFEDLGGWQAIVYELSMPGVTNAHIRAHYVKAGTWIDVHLSLTSKMSREESIEALKALLASFTVTERG